MKFFYTHISPKAIELATEALRSTFISEGSLVRRFEEALTRDFGLTNPVALNSGTSALHLALVLARLAPKDEVILPAQTFVASGLAILMCGAKPVFADIQHETGNIDPISVVQKLSDRTRVIMPVHWAGLPYDVDEINTIAAQHSIAVVEDAAHAFGAKYKGRAVGSLSSFSAFSFQAIKHLTTGDGGALCCLDSANHEEARRRRWFGIDRERNQPSELGERNYDLHSIGFKYHMNDLAAAVGLGNLGDLRANLARHQEIANTYRNHFSDVAGLKLLKECPDRTSSAWIFTMLCEQRDEFMRAMKSRGVPVSVVHLGIDRNQVFGGQDNSLVAQRYFDAHQVALPVHVGLRDVDVHRIVDAVRAGW